MAKEKRREGRPYRFSPEIVRKLEEAASLDCSISEMAFHAEISKPTYYAIIKRDPKLFARLEALREKPFINCRLTIQRNIKDGDGKLALQYLERRKKEEFAPRSEVTGADGAPLIDTTWVNTTINDPVLSVEISKLMGKIAKK